MSSSRGIARAVVDAVVKGAAKSEVVIEKKGFVFFLFYVVLVAAPDFVQVKGRLVPVQADRQRVSRHP